MRPFALVAAVAIAATMVVSGLGAGGQTPPSHPEAADASAGSSAPWIGRAGVTVEGARLLTELRDARSHGLDPTRYGVPEIGAALAQGDAASRTRASRLLSRGYAAFARDLRHPSSDVQVTYIDAELSPDRMFAGEPSSLASQVDGLRQLNPIYRQLRDGLAAYRSHWSRLPQIAVPAGETLEPGSRSPRVTVLRQRLGLASKATDDDVLDADLATALGNFRKVHGLGDGPVADRATIAALNAGALHYERLIAANLDRVRALPVDGRRYIVVDTAGATLSMIERGRIVGTMRVIVGKVAMPTPQLVGFLRFAVFNPYWNIPPDLVRRSVAVDALRRGPAYFAQRRLALYTDWRPSARSLLPEEIDWTAVAAGRESVWVRQLPGADNMLGKVKFMLPNRLGIYLHDTPNKTDFARSDRRLSSGCVRVEDARLLAEWSFGDRPIDYDNDAPERRVDLPDPIPVYITYLTAYPDGASLRFRPDAYHRDQAAIAQLAQALNPRRWRRR